MSVVQSALVVERIKASVVQQYGPHVVGNVYALYICQISIYFLIDPYGKSSI